MAGGHPGGDGGRVFIAECVQAEGNSLGFLADAEDVAYFTKRRYVIHATELPDDSGTGQPIVGSGAGNGPTS